MGRLRPVLVALFVLYLVMLAVYASVQLLRNMQPLLSWLGLLLAAAGPLAYFCWNRLAKPHSGKQQPLGFTLVSGLGLAVTMTLSWRHGNSAGMIHAWAGLALVGWVGYLRWLRDD